MEHSSCMIQPATAEVWLFDTLTIRQSLTENSVGIRSQLFMPEPGNSSSCTLLNGQRNTLAQ